jgi:hypothetical protein
MLLKRSFDEEDKMKKLLLCILVAAAFLFAGPAYADLVTVDASNHVYKTTTGGQTLYWYLDLNYTKNNNYGDQKALAEALSINSSVGVLEDWQMATGTQIHELLKPKSVASTQAGLVAAALLASSSPLRYGNSYYARYDEYTYTIQGVDYYKWGYVYSVSGNWISRYDNAGSQQETYKDNFVGAWLTQVVPIPGAVWLLGSGLAGLIAIRRKFKK